MPIFLVKYCITIYNSYRRSLFFTYHKYIVKKYTCRLEFNMKSSILVKLKRRGQKGNIT